MANDSGAAADFIKCASCPERAPRSEWPVNPSTGKPKTRCSACSAKNASNAKKRRAQRAPEPVDQPSRQKADKTPPECDCAARNYPCARGQPQPEPIGKDDQSTPISWNAFRTLLDMRGRDACDLYALVELEDTVDEENERLPDDVLSGDVVRLIYDEVGYRFNLHTVERGQNATRFKYFCSQRDGMQTTSQKGKPRAGSDKPRGKERATMPMQRWHCEGWLSVSIVHGSYETDYARVHLYHGLKHKGYTDVSLSDEAKALIREMENCTAPKIFKEFLRRDAATTVTRKQIYRYLSSITKNRWHLDDDQVVSARKLLEQWDGDQVLTIPIPDEDGVSVIAFAFKDIVERLNTGVVELGLDSTFKTNSAGWEMYGILTEVNGQAMPLVTILITTTAAAQPGAKQRVLESALRWLYDRCPNAQFSLSDKDPSEINACRVVIPEGKHQLCYWHSLRYVEERLGQSTPPAAYDAHGAHNTFSFIDPTWAPGVTNGNIDEDFDGRGNVSITAASFELHVDDIPVDELETCLPPLFNLTVGDVRVPFWPLPPRRKELPKLPEFCPARFRPHIIAMFRKHFHLHPEIPLDSQGTRLSASEIHKSAVHQMYSFCWQHDLSQTWAYLWNRWYSPSQWPLWARAPCPAIPVLKTTMIVESYWRVIKHRDLAEFNRPSLDLLLFLLVTSTLPPLLQRLDELLGVLRDGRPSGLASWQQDMKAEWLELSKPDALRNMQKELQVLKNKGCGLRYFQVRADRLAELEADRARPRGDYHTDIDRWTCSCPAYLINRFLTCKHLVQKANRLLGDIPRNDNWFWFNMRRRRLPPYYAIPGIHVAPDPDPVYHPTITPRSEFTQAHTARSSTRASTPDLPNPIDEHDTGRHFLSSPERRELKDTFDTVYGVLTQPQGVDPRLRKQVEPAVKRLREFTDHVHSAKRARTSQRTFADTNKDTLFLD